VSNAIDTDSERGVRQIPGPLPLLKGYKVIEVGQNLAGPYASAILGDLGAEVIKIEKTGGDDVRSWGPPFIAGSSTSFHVMNRNKASVVLALETPEGRAALLNLVREADVFIHNLRPGVADKLRISGADLLEVNPKLVYCDISAFGHSGPLGLKPGYEALIQAFSGLMSINGDPERPPSRIGASVVDMGTGMWTAIGALAALLARTRTNSGAVVDTSLYETALTWMGRHIADYQTSSHSPARQGSGHSGIVPYQAFQALDGPIVIAAGNDRLFLKLAAALGYSEWAQDARFATNPARVTNKALLIPMIQNSVNARTIDETFKLLDMAGIPCAPVYSVSQVVAHPQTQSLKIMIDNTDAGLHLVGLPISVNGTRPGFGKVGPDIGADTKTVLTSLMQQPSSLTTP
jgi:crotonobetainyl-CoA:carnitine CoA-transferase CaiB-like acyl-CoA transferase